MKNRKLLFLVLLCFVPCFFVTGCKNEVTVEDTSDVAYINVQLCSDLSRAIYPYFEVKNFMDITLTGTCDGNTTVLRIWEKAEDMNSYYGYYDPRVALKPGIWDFQLTALVEGSEYEGVLKNVQILKGDNHIYFNLIPKKLNFEGYVAGEIGLSINVPVSNLYVTASLKRTCDDLYCVEETQLLLSPMAIGAYGSFYFRDIEAGIYEIIFRIYTDSSKKVELNRVSDYIVLGANMFAKGEIQIDALEKYYTLTYDTNDGYHFSDNSIYSPVNKFTTSFSRKSSFKLTDDVTKSGYTFDGWYLDDSTFNNPITEIKEGTTGDITVYAKWVPKTYNIVFHSGDSDGQENYTQTVGYEQSIKLGENKFKAKTGYEFAGWSYTYQGDVDLEAGSDFTLQETKDVDLYAVWKPGLVKYTVESWFLNIEGTGYERSDSETFIMYGKTGDMTAAVQKSYRGFYGTSFFQEKIKADGSTVVKVYYCRQQYTYKVDYWMRSFTLGTHKGLYESKVEIGDTYRQGYIFNGWEPEMPETFVPGYEDVFFRSKWIPCDNTKYTVKHFQQNIENDDYTCVSETTEYGTTDTQATYSCKNYPGFTSVSTVMPIIAADGSTVVEYFYNRNTYNYTFNFENGEDSKTVSGKYGAKVQLPFTSIQKTGYDFVGWDSEIPESFTADNRTFTAKWKPSASVSYTVKYYLQNLSNEDYTYDSECEEYGTTGLESNTVPKKLTGFTALPVTQKTIAADGSTVVEVYYNRLISTYTFKLENGQADIVVKGKYQEKVNITEPSKPGYVFGGWNSTVPETFGAEDIIFTAKWNPATNTEYIVKHHLQNISNDGYQQKDTQTRCGTTEDITTAEINEYTGFIALPVTQKTIAADGSTVVDIYYNRIVYTITFELSGGKGTTSVAGRYGAEVPSVTNPTKDNYIFNGWDKEIPLKFTEDETITACWSGSAIKLTILSNEDNLTLTSSMTSSDYTFTSPAGYKNYYWYLDSKLIESGNKQIITINKSELLENSVYALLLVCEDSKGIIHSVNAEIVTGGF